MSDSVPRKKKERTIAGHLLKGHKVTQDEPDFDKDNKISTTVDGKTSLPLLDTPHQCDNKHGYTGSNNDETPVSMKSHAVSMKSHPGVLVKNYLDILRPLEFEKENVSDHEYVPYEELKGENIEYDTKENLINRLLSKNFTKGFA